MTDRTQLHHLADRARRGALLPAEGALLADAVTALAESHDFWQQLAQDAREAEGRRTAERDEQQTRAVRAEAAIARARTLATRWAVLRTHGGASHELRDALDPVPDPSTVTITQARHDHLLAGQCIHHQETHRLHHGEPVTGCPYQGCHPDA